MEIVMIEKIRNDYSSKDAPKDSGLYLYGSEYGAEKVITTFYVLGFDAKKSEVTAECPCCMDSSERAYIQQRVDHHLQVQREIRESSAPPRLSYVPPPIVWWYNYGKGFDNLNPEHFTFVACINEHVKEKFKEELLKSL